MKRLAYWRVNEYFPLRVARFSTPYRRRVAVMRGSYEDLRELPLLQLTSRAHLWMRYFENSHDTLHFGARFSQYPMLIQGALTKLGAALLPEFAASAPLASGELVAVDTPRILENTHYMLVVPNANVNAPAIQNIVQALCGESEIF